MWYFIFRFTGSLIFKMFFKLRIEGLEHIPKKSNFIIVANHNSFLDPVVIGACVPRKIHCISLRNLYKIPIMKWVLQRLETLPSGSSSLQAVKLLQENKNVGLFPEGGVSRDGKLKDFRRGAVLLALKTGRPIVPCAIIGTFHALPFGSSFPKFVPIKVKIGKPVYLLKEFDDIIDDIKIQEGLKKIRTTIAEMLQ
jgi:1-acyl-sn-glycerol-3-phosphate acyltransferase